ESEFQMAWRILERIRGEKRSLPVRRWLFSSLAIFSLAILLSSGAPAQSPAAARAQSQKLSASKAAIPAAEFSRMVGLFSEEEGSFFSDNFVSNETGYLH